MSEFINMGGYAAFVWGSFGTAAVVFIWNLLTPRLRRNEILKELSSEE